MKNVLHNFKGWGEKRKKEREGLEPRAGRFQVSLFPPAATASYDTEVYRRQRERLQVRKKKSIGAGMLRIIRNRLTGWVCLINTLLIFHREHRAFCWDRVWFEIFTCALNVGTVEKEDLQYMNAR